MRLVYIVVIGIALTTTSISSAASSGKLNRRNRRGPSLQVVQKTQHPKSTQSTKNKSHSKASPIVHMPSAFDPSVVDPKDYVEESVSYESPPPEPVEETVVKAEKRPHLIKNDPEKQGVDPSVFYQKLSGESRRVFQEMDHKGKILALRLSIPYEDPNKAVEDASFEMMRRQQTANARQKRTQRKRSAYY